MADSRCPVDVTCVWAGEIRFAFSLESPQSEAPRLEFELATTAPVATVRGLQFELLGSRAAAALDGEDRRRRLSDLVAGDPCAAGRGVSASPVRPEAVASYRSRVSSTSVK